MKFLSEIFLNLASAYKENFMLEEFLRKLHNLKPED
jgi:hypothetical protein